MKANHGQFRRAAMAAAISLAFCLAPQVSSASSKEGHDFAGAFIVEHTSTVKPEQGIIEVDVVGGGCVTGAIKAYCDNHGTQIVALANNAGTATYTLYMPGGSVALKLTFEPDKGGGDPATGIRFGGSFVVVADSGTGLYRHTSGSGEWSGGAEFTAPLVPGKNPPGPGRWAFWGTIKRH